MLRAAIVKPYVLGRLVAPVPPVVAGVGVTAEAGSRCRSEGVWLLLNGRVVTPDGTAATSG